MTTRTLGLVCSAAGGVEQLREQLIEPLQNDGWRVAVTATPTAAHWLEVLGEAPLIEELTGYPLRSRPRLPTEVSPHPPVSSYAVVPATANFVAKLALGIADSQALTHACEALGAGIPMVVFPRINAAHANQPAWQSHITALRNAGAHLIYGDAVWPLNEPGGAPGKPLPWQPILEAITRGTPSEPSDHG